MIKWGRSGPSGISAAKKGIWGNVSGISKCSFMHNTYNSGAPEGAERAPQSLGSSLGC